MPPSHRRPWPCLRAAALLLAAGCASGALTAEQINERVASPDPEVRRALARDPALTPEALATLAKDPDDQVRALVVAHPAARADTVRKMADDRSLRVMDALSRSPRTPPEKLAAFARQFRPERAGHAFWQQLVDNAATPLDVRVELLGKITAALDQAAGVPPVDPEVARAVAGAWQFEIAPWTPRQPSPGLAGEAGAPRAAPLLAAVRAERYALALTPLRAAKLTCPGCEALVGTWTWAADRGQVRVELRPRGAVTWRVEGAPGRDRVEDAMTGALEVSAPAPLVKPPSGPGAPPSAPPRPGERDALRFAVSLERAAEAAPAKSGRGAAP